MYPLETCSSNSSFNFGKNHPNYHIFHGWVISRWYDGWFTVGASYFSTTPHFQPLENDLPSGGSLHGLGWLEGIISVFHHVFHHVFHLFSTFTRLKGELWPSLFLSDCVGETKGELVKVLEWHNHLGGGFKHSFYVHPYLRKMIQFDKHIFQMGWNHQRDDYQPILSLLEYMMHLFWLVLMGKIPFLTNIFQLRWT